MSSIILVPEVRLELTILDLVRIDGPPGRVSGIFVLLQ
jgi:hypothetical protein